MKTSGFVAVNAFLLVMVAAATAAQYETHPLIPPAMYAVHGAPFTARIDSVWEGTAGFPAGQESTKVVRDRAGRQRFEMPSLDEAFATGLPVSVRIYDVVGERMIDLDPRRRVAVVRRMEHLGRPISIDLSVNPAVPQHPALGGQFLGMQQIAGQETWGQHLVQSYRGRDGSMSTTVRELWLSTIYRMPLLQVSEDARLGKIIQEVVGFESGEPDESLFEIPSGYTVVNR